MTRRNRSKSGAQTECPDCGRKLRGSKGLKTHMADEHGKQPVLTSLHPGRIMGWKLIAEARP